MIRKEEVYKIGIFNKPHGIHGELSFTFTDDIFDRVDCDYFICLLDGIFVPFFIEEYRFRSDSTALVKQNRENSPGISLLVSVWRIPLMVIWEKWQM